MIAKLEADNGQKFDLVFCGKEATDAALGQGGLMLAEELGTSVITNITEIALDGDKVTAKTGNRRRIPYSRSFCTMCCNSHKNQKYDPTFLNDQEIKNGSKEKKTNRRYLKES